MAKKRSVAKKKGGQAARPEGGPVPPYGPAIWDAVRRNDVLEMKAVAEAARKALYRVEFSRVSGAKADEAKKALAELDAAIAKLEYRG